jgi:hypothetical protein
MNKLDVCFVVELEIFSLAIPLWAIILCLLIVVVLIWQFFRFTIKLLLFFILFFVLLIGLDLLGVFAWVKDNILASFL